MKNKKEIEKHEEKYFHINKKLTLSLALIILGILGGLSALGTIAQILKKVPYEYLSQIVNYELGILITICYITFGISVIINFAINILKKGLNN